MEKEELKVVYYCVRFCFSKILLQVPDAEYRPHVLRKSQKMPKPRMKNIPLAYTRIARIRRISCPNSPSHYFCPLDFALSCIDLRGQFQPPSSFHCFQSRVQSLTCSPRRFQSRDRSRIQSRISRVSSHIYKNVNVNHDATSYCGINDGGAAVVCADEGGGGLKYHRWRGD